MTKQETFDIVARHLLTQNKQARGVYGDPSSRPACVYRGDDGVKCAAGCLIPDEKYRPEMEGELADTGPVAVVLAEEGHNLGLVRELQKVHDHSHVCDWPRGLRSVSGLHGLSDAVVTELRGPASPQ